MKRQFEVMERQFEVMKTHFTFHILILRFIYIFFAGMFYEKLKIVSIFIQNIKNESLFFNETFIRKA